MQELEDHFDHQAGIKRITSERHQLLLADAVIFLILRIDLELALGIVLLYQIHGNCCSFTEDSAFGCDELWGFADWVCFLEAVRSSMFVGARCLTLEKIEVVLNSEFFKQP